LSKKPEVVVLTKIEGLDDEIVQDLIKQLRKVVPQNTEVLAISAPSKKGLKELLWKIKAIVIAEREMRAAEEPEEAGLPVLTIDAGEDAWNVEKQRDTYIVHGAKIERFAARTHFDSEEGVQRLRHIMHKMGISHQLVRQGINPGDPIRFGTSPNKIIY
jgi:GTPase